MEKSNGILILAFGDRGYHYAAFNLCLSIKHKNKNVKVAIYHSPQDFVKYELAGADILKEFQPDYEPGYNKINCLSDLPFDNTLYIDADSYCTKDIQPLINDLIKQNNFFMCDIFGRGKYGSKIEYDIWAEHEISYDFFNIPKENDFISTQTSWMFAKKGKELNQFLKEIRFYWKKGFPKQKLKSQWGKYLPDELFFSAILSKNKIDARYNSKPMFYGINYIDSLGEIDRNFYLMSLHGNGNGSTLTKQMYWEYYDRCMKVIAKETGQQWYKKDYLMRAKITNSKG
jgi:hypothetical protein